jgi:Ca2+-binding EF-hand superfamily protein
MRTLLIACAGALGLAGAALAQDITTGHLAALDTDGNGAVDAAEYDAFMGQAFTALDKNGDGYVTEAEGAGVITAEHFAAANANGDDGISQQEFQATTAADFERADVDGNGTLD